MANRALAIKKVKAYASNPELIKEPTMGEMADLVVLVLSAVQQIEESIKAGRLDGKTPVADKDYLSKAAALQMLNEAVNRMVADYDTQMRLKGSALESQVEAAIQRIRDGKDGIVSEAEIERAAEIAASLIQVPDFDALVTTEITRNGTSVRDALELLQGDDRLSPEAILGLTERLSEITELARAASYGGGTIGKQQVYSFIRQAVADGTIPSSSGLPDQTGNSGKFLTTDGSDASWATLAGGGDMAAATYDPANKAEQVLTVSDLSDTAYDATTWNGVTNKAPSKNAVRDKIEALDAAKANTSHTHAISDVTNLQTSLDAKAPLASPSFTGTVTLPTGLTGVLRADSGVVSTDSDVTDIVAAATSTAAGKVELATDAETVTGTDTNRATTPANITARLADPGTIGGTTPGAATFTTVTTTGNIELGHASDTTISRVSAGVIAVEGVNLVRAGAATSSGLTMATSRVLGRTTASTGAIEELTSVDSFVSAASDTTAGKIEIATTSETNTGTDTGRAVSPDGLAGSYAGTKSVVLDVIAAGTDLTTGDNKYSIVMPSSVNGMDLVAAHARVFTAGTTGTTDIQLHNVTDAVDILSTKITIDSTETSSYTAATAPVINTSNDSIATGDIIRVDIDAISTTAPKGLQVILEMRLP